MGARHDQQPLVGLWITLVAAVFYCVWLGAHWLPLGLSEHELAASASRVWDIKRELVEHHSLTWWTPWYMSGSSYGLNHARGFYLVPWILFTAFTDLITAGKLVGLLAIFTSAVTMYFCARHFLKNGWAAVLAAMAFMLHPEQIIRAAGAEHMTISLFFPIIPLLWLTLARALESNRFSDTFVCALVAVLGWWVDNKQALVQFLFLFTYALYWLWPRRAQWKATARTCGVLAALGLGLGAWVIVPGVVESKYVKLFRGDPLVEWQKGYSFKSLLGLVDRNGVVATDAYESVFRRLQASSGRVESQAELDQVRRVAALKMDSPEKYMGLVLLAVISVTVLGNQKRADRRAFWFFVAALLVSVMLATGLTSVWSANWTTWKALSSQRQSGVAFVAVLACVVFLVLFYVRKLTTTRKKFVAVIALAIFLFVPGFEILAGLPYFKDIRAPFVFYDVPGVFWGSMLIGFFVTDVLSAERWRARTPMIVATVTSLLLLDYWPYQSPMKDNGVPARTLQNLEATYVRLRQDSDWVKVYPLSGRYFHLLGPMWSGKPQVTEAFYDWMAPIGTGLLTRSGGGTGPFLDLLNARYIVFDKTDTTMQQSPQGQQLQDAYRQAFPVEIENDDFIVFRNNSAHPYVTAYKRACAYVGNVTNSAPLALALSARNWPLVQRETIEDAGRYEQIYREGEPAMAPVRDGQVAPLTDVQLHRNSDEVIQLRLTAPSPCLAVIAESYYPFWHAEVDGKPAEVLRVSCGLMGLELPAGKHEIFLRYQAPRVYAVAGIVSLLSFVIGLVATIRLSVGGR